MVIFSIIISLLYTFTIILVMFITLSLAHVSSGILDRLLPKALQQRLPFPEFLGRLVLGRAATISRRVFMNFRNYVQKNQKNVHAYVYIHMKHIYIYILVYMSINICT